METRIYVASLADYNAGRLHGVWVDLEGKDKDEVLNEIQEMLKESKEETAEEWAIHDYEGFGDYPINEYEGIDDLVSICEGIEEFGECFPYLCSHFADIEEARRCMSDGGYYGAYDDLSDWAESYLEDTGSLGDMPENLKYYFDYEKFARDCDYSGDIFTIEDDVGQTHVFSNNY